MRKQSTSPVIKVEAEEFNQALRKYSQPTFNFAKTLLPGETLEEFMQKYKAANKGGYILRYTKKAIKTNDYALWWGSATQAVDNQNTINIYDALVTGKEPKIVDPDAFLNALRSPWRRAKLPVLQKK